MTHETPARVERFRDVGDYLHQLATLAAGSIVLLGTFSASTSVDRDGAGFAIVAIILFAICIVSAMFARLAAIALAHGYPGNDNDSERRRAANFGVWTSVVGVAGFALGVVSLATYAAIAI